MRAFGQTRDGQDVQAIDIAAGDLRATIVTYGARLQDVRLRGVDRSLTEGGSSMADYEGAMLYHGPVIGPVVNRLQNAKLPVAGKVHDLVANMDGGHTLHSGPADTGQRVWDVLESAADRVTLGLTLADGDGGFPGQRQVRVIFEVTAPATLRMTIHGETDRPTAMNFANHSYWNLDGTAQFDGHHLTVPADHILPTDDHGIPTGQIAPVDGTALDFRQGQFLVSGAVALDHNLCLSDARAPLRDVLRLTGVSGVGMTVATTEAGVQLYDGRPAYSALAIEAQAWPDAPNQAGFAAIDVSPDDPYLQITEWRFDRD